jgi:hypothetical protein
MGRNLIRSGIILLVASMIAVGWVLFSQTTIAESLVPERSQFPAHVAIGEGQHENEPGNETRTNAFSPFVRGVGEGRDGIDFSPRSRPSFTHDEPQTGTGANVPTGRIRDTYGGGRGEADLNIGRLFASIVAHLVMIGLVVLVVVAIRKGFGLLSNRLKSASVGGAGS